MSGYFVDARSLRFRYADYKLSGMYIFLEFANLDLADTLT